MSHNYWDNGMFKNALISVWNSEVRDYAWKHGQIQCSIVHGIVWGFNVVYQVISTFL